MEHSSRKPTGYPSLPSISCYCGQPFPPASAWTVRLLLQIQTFWLQKLSNHAESQTLAQMSLSSVRTSVSKPKPSATEIRNTWKVRNAHVCFVGFLSNEVRVLIRKYVVRKDLLNWGCIQTFAVTCYLQSTLRSNASQMITRGSIYKRGNFLHIWNYSGSKLGEIQVSHRSE